MDRKELLTSFYSDVLDIMKRRKVIWSTFMHHYDFSLREDISTFKRRDLSTLFYCYDSLFFHDFFTNSFKGKLLFSFSNRLRRSGGMIYYPLDFEQLNERDVKIEIKMATQLFLDYYNVSKDKVVNGIKTEDVFEAFLLVFEHEICHLIELIFYYRTSCRGRIFKELSYKIFGHRNVYHELPLGDEVALEKYGIGVGDYVYFDYKGERYSGFVKRITKRATVYIPDPHGNHVENGMRFKKWYVPLKRLKKHSSSLF